ncbi:uncharacterized protein [Epargyreus clarus]|uniref:uncharacterized protein n=1 Tax=Epargyreus clarus TaxID=520877 RepID=UPI003C304943
MGRACSFGCRTSGVVMHCFPNPEKYFSRFKAWVTLVGGKLETQADVEYYRKKKVCSIHFTDKDRNRYKRLNALAIPSVHLSGESNVENSILPGPSNLQNDRFNASVTITSSSLTDGSIVQDIAQPGSSNVENIIPNTAAPLASSLTGCSSNTWHAIRMEHSYSVISRQRRNKTIKGATKQIMEKHTCVQMKPLFTKIKYLKSEICRLRKRCVTFKSRLESAHKMSSDMVFNSVVEKMTKPAQLFVSMQCQSGKKSKGRRFSLEEKILSLSLYKKSPKSYSLLCKYFTLPSSKAMKKLLSDVKLCPGINAIIFNKIKKNVKCMDISDRTCSLSFDEMSLNPQISYNKQKDSLEGFTTNENKNIADHVLVFMVKGIKNNFKQPVAYYFTNRLGKVELKATIKTVVKHIFDCGLIVINTVCDQSPVNVSAVTELINDSKAAYMRLEKRWCYDLIFLNGHNIIPLFDAPHLIKGIRNNLINKDMVYTIKNERKTVKWVYFQMVYAADKSCGELRLLHKLSEEHVNPQKINKMRVKTATQLFSHSVAVVTDHLTARGDLPQECRDLVDITILLNNVFDTLNVNTLHIPNGKIYKGPIRGKSPHHELWKKAKTILKSVKFIKIYKQGDNIRLTESTVPSVNNLIKTIEGMESIWKILSKKYKFDALLTRNLNQDPLENFFGNIRSYGARNIAPNTVAFEGAFKALLLNNYNANHSKKANCEEDGCELLQSFKFFINEKTPDVPQEDNDIINFNSSILLNDIKENDSGQRNYVCGWVLTKCLKHIVKGCQQCKNSLLDINNNNLNNDFIKRKEYKQKSWLCYPSKEIQNCFQDLQNITESFLIQKDIQKKNIQKNIIAFANLLVNFPSKCSEHKIQLQEYFMSNTCNILLYSWCRSVNRILSGKIKYNGNDETKIVAQSYYDKHKNNKNKKIAIYQL